MITPWGELAVSDAHVHFFSHSFFATLAPALPPEEIGQRLGWTMPPLDPAELAVDWARELDRHSVAQAALIASIPGDEAAVAAAVRAAPGRFFGYFMLNPLAPGAVDRARSALDAGLRGICLFPAMHRYSIGDPCLRPILDLAPAVVFVHCGVLTVGVRRKLGLPSPFDMRYSNPIDLHPVALNYPH
ncbi:MAG: amidohydrolase family protein, partial [Bryobacteraceae bacterium]